MFRRLISATVFVILSAANLVAVDAPAKVRMLVDFEAPEAIQLGPSQATASIVPIDGSRRLEIATEADAKWPSVRIAPAAGSWDLSDFYSVQIDIRNPQDVPVRVLLSLHGPQSDGQTDCSVSATTVAPGGTATLEAPFGVWHGENREIDPSKIVAVSVLLDRPGRSHKFVVDDIRAVPWGLSALDELASDEFFQKLTPTLGRGVNLGNMLEAPREGAWGVRLEARYFRLIQVAGFDSVRIPVRWSAHAGQEAPYHIDQEFFDRVEWAVRQAMSHRLYAVLNMHHYEEIFDHPEEHRERFLALWGQIAERFKDYPQALYFELLNEPHAKLDAQKWNDLLRAAIATVRQTNPIRKIVIGPGEWNSVSALPSLMLPEEDRHLIVTFHYYNPFQFTHQGAGWVGGNADRWLGTTWTGTPGERQAVIRDLDKALAWAVKHRRPMYLGEFGAYSKADLESRARWTRFVADEAVKRKMSFAYWEFCAGFGVYDPRENSWVGPLKDALLPGPE
jgi:endoglucanase